MADYTSEEIERAVAAMRRVYRIGGEQRRRVIETLSGKDVFVSLPTGYSKLF